MAESRQPNRTKALTEPDVEVKTAAPYGEHVLMSQPAFLEAHPTALAIYCSDGRFTDAVEDLMRRSRGHERFDAMLLPGGPALLDSETASMVERETMRPSTSFLIRSHGIREVCLIAHAGCGFYKCRYAGMPAANVLQRQMDDICRAAEWVGKTHGVAVWPYFATPSGGRVRFTPVELKK